MKKHFIVYHPGEAAAGIEPLNDTITVEVASGDPGGEPGEFEEAMVHSLSDWYDANCKIWEG
jgi:hypothetical protein